MLQHLKVLNLKVLALLPAGFGLMAAHAQAAILCEGGFQVVHGIAVSTPYCQDEELAKYEREQGRKISGETIRWNSEAKQKACIDSPYTSASSCADYLGD